MPSIAVTTDQNANQLMAGPRCAQCRTIMTLERVEPHPRDASQDRHSFVCRTCGLPDHVDRMRIGG